MNELAQSAPPLSAGSLAHLTLSLAAIVALIFAIGWVLKRFKIAGPRGGGGDIAVLDEFTLSPRERIILLRVGDGQVLVGVGAGGMVGLTPLAAPLSVRSTPPEPAFADRLRELIKRPGSER